MNPPRTYLRSDQIYLLSLAAQIKFLPAKTKDLERENRARNEGAPNGAGGHAILQFIHGALSKEEDTAMVLFSGEEIKGAPLHHV